MAGDLSKVYLSPQEQNPVRQNSVTRQVLEKLSKLGFVTPEDFGAVGDGITDDTAAVQAAVNAVLQTTTGSLTPSVVFLAKVYLISSAITVSIPVAGPSYFNIIGKAKYSSGLITTTASISMLKIDTTASAGFFFEVANFTLLGNGTQNGIEFVGSNGVSYSSFDHLFFNKMTNGFYHSTNTINYDWNQFTNNTFLNIVNGFNLRGWGTGTVFANGNLVMSGGGAGFLLGNGGSATIGDMSFVGWQMGGPGTGFVIDGGVYGGNISINNVQFDAGVSPGFILTNVHDINCKNVNYGGAVAANTVDLPSCTDLDLDERRILPAATAATTFNDYVPGTGTGGVQFTASGVVNITGIANGYDARRMEIYNLAASSNNITLTSSSTSSSANNRFALGATVTLTPGTSILMIYTTSSNRWIRRGGM